MGSSSTQAPLWGQYPQEWSTIQEATGLAGYEYVLAHLQWRKGITLLDVGCGSGVFAAMANAKGAAVTALDATPSLIEAAKQRAPAVNFLVGEMEELPFEDHSFDIVTGFNSFQYAASVSNAFTEARRMLKPGGQLAVMIWGNKEDCEAATYLKAVGSLLPPPPPGAGGPFALSENQLLEKTLQTAGFTITSVTDIPTLWDYPDLPTAMAGLLSAGPAVKAIHHSGYDKAYEIVGAAVQPYIQFDGHIRYHNKFRIVLAIA
jgi:SAM-dependent methyltransferase